MSPASLRIVLASRAPRPDYAVRLDGAALVIEGVPLLPDRRIALGDVHGLERAGTWLWVGAGCVPALIGGEDVPALALARLEAELRAALGALPGGARILARIDGRRTVRRHLPWLGATLALAFVLAYAAAAERGDALLFATRLALFAGLAASAEPWLGARRLAVAAASAGVAAAAAGAAPAALPLVFALAFAGPLVFARIAREPALGVRARSAFDVGLLIAGLAMLDALGSGVGHAALATGLASLALAPLALRRWP